MTKEGTMSTRCPKRGRFTEKSKKTQTSGELYVFTYWKTQFR